MFSGLFCPVFLGRAFFFKKSYTQHLTDIHFWFIFEALNHTSKIKTMYVVRQSNHIESDLKRQWSSWNFGMDGFHGTWDDLMAAFNDAEESGIPVEISAFEYYEKPRNVQFGELYENYWVVIDGNFTNRLACNIVDADTLDTAIELVSTNKVQPGGDGDMVDTSDAKLVWSNGDLHILFIED